MGSGDSPLLGLDELQYQLVAGNNKTMWTSDLFSLFYPCFLMFFMSCFCEPVNASRRKNAMQVL